jgi:hypothetical protein
MCSNEMRVDSKPQQSQSVLQIDAGHGVPDEHFGELLVEAARLVFGEVGAERL